MAWGEISPRRKICKAVIAFVPGKWINNFLEFGRENRLALPGTLLNHFANSTY